MKIGLVKYNTFIMCLYMNSFILTIIFEILDLNFPVPLVFIILFCFTFLKNTVNRLSLFSLIFLTVILLNIIFLSTKINNILLLLYIKILIATMTGVLYCNLKISLNLLKKYLKYFLLINSIFLILILKSQSIYKALEFDYMDWGYNFLPIVLFWTYYYQEKLKYKYFLIALISLSLLFLFGSRFGFLIGFIGAIFFLYQSKNKFLRYGIFFVGIFSSLILFNLKKFLLLIIEILKKFKLPTESVGRIIYSWNNFMNGKDISSGRNIIYIQTIETIKKNILFGSGIFGYIGNIEYRNKNGTFYPHNIFLEILLQFGVIGIIVFFLIIFVVVRKIYFERKKGYRISRIYFVFIVLSLKLLLSSSYLQDKWFWFTLLIPFNKSYYYKIKNIK